MKIRVFHSAEGDCLLITGKDDTRMLVDGGMPHSFREHVSPFLGKLADQDEALDVVCVSHIDEDHIAGVLEMLDHEVEWRVHLHHLNGDHPDHPEPDHARPPAIGEIWHNAFHEQMSDNAGPIADLFAAMSRVLAFHPDRGIQHTWTHGPDLATSERQAIRLSRRIGDAQLGIDLNPRDEGKLMFARAGRAPFDVGSFTVRVLGPFEADLAALRERWDRWLDRNQGVLAGLQGEAAEDEASLLGSGVAAAGPFLRTVATALGNRGDVTVPNLASLTLLVEEDGKRVLLTGDAHEDDILTGLERSGVIAAGAGLHVDVLKVPHHGSEHNLSETLAKRITADHYVFCADGADENPDLAVVDVLLRSRVGEPAQLSPNPEASDPFRLWFSSSPTALHIPTRAAHMEAVRDKVRDYQGDTPGRIRYRFLRHSSLEFDV